jgi:hypothetical protein
VLVDDPYSEEATWLGPDGVLQRLADVATARGIDLSALDGGLLSQATAVSADGLVVAGNAWIGPPARGVVRGFVLVLPAPEVDDDTDRPGLAVPTRTGCASTPAPVIAAGLLAVLLRPTRRRGRTS